MKNLNQILRSTFVVATLFFSTSDRNSVTAQILSGVEALKASCAADPNAYVAVLYQSSDITTYQNNACILSEVDSSLAQSALFCRTANCNVYNNSACIGGPELPLPVVFPAGFILANVGNVSQQFGASFTCSMNGLSGVSLPM